MERDAATATKVLCSKLDELKRHGVLHDGHARVQGDAVRLALRATDPVSGDTGAVPPPLLDALADHALNARTESVITSSAWTVIRLSVTPDVSHE